ncbi:MAG: hypothetical protein ACI3ZD_00020, partial [Prevotella sp.]
DLKKTSVSIRVNPCLKTSSYVSPLCLRFFTPTLIHQSAESLPFREYPATTTVLCRRKASL